MVIWNVPAATGKAVRVGKVTRAVAVPVPASAGTHTGPWNWFPQQRSSSVNFITTGAPPALAGGKATSSTGLQSSGTCS